MAYKTKVAIDANGTKEERSVLFILNLLHGRTCNRIDLGTTQSNIDGYIELLDSSNRTNGKITVQVKTVNKRDEGFNRYPCPTSLFAYAEVTTDNVFLLAVDHSCNKVLWKHISRELLEANRNKENQDTITLHFDSNEELRVDNISKTLNTWLKICKSYIELISHGENIIAENKELKAKLLELPETHTTLCKEDIVEIQSFYDCYNHLLENEFKAIKSNLFPNTWKRGIAIYTYSDNQLEYSLFNIKNGELVAPIVQLPKQSIFELKHTHDYAEFSCANNKLKENPCTHSLSIIKKHLDDFIKSKRVIPFDEDFLKEYIHDFIEANLRSLHLKQGADLDIQYLLEYFQNRYPEIDKLPIHLISGGRSIYINTVYDAIKCLAELGYQTIPYPYPQKGKFGDTGMVYDWFSPITALQKAKVVIFSTIRAYQNFIQSNFPLLVNDLDAFYGGNLISVLVDYSDPRNKFIFHVYFFRSSVPSNEKILIIEDIASSKIMKENNLSSPSDLYTKPSVLFNGKQFSCFRGGGLSDMTILFDKYNCLTYFYELLRTHFEDYFKKKGL